MDLKELYRRHQESIEKRQKDCLHRAGCNSRSAPFGISPFSSIVWHTLRTETIGICTVCGRHFKSVDSDYKFWRSQPSYNVPSATDDGVWKPVSKEDFDEGSKIQFYDEDYRADFYMDFLGVVKFPSSVKEE